MSKPGARAAAAVRSGFMARAIIIGAGLGGTLLACYLARRGYRVDVFERRPDPRSKGYAGGRSINLALSTRGLAGLAGVGLDSVVMERDAIAMRGRMMHGRDGATAYQPYSSNPADAINSVSRGGLNLTLLNEAARLDSVRMHFEHACIDVDIDRPAAVFERPGGGVVREEADLLLGVDGAFSAVRNRLMKTDRFEYEQTYLKHGYKELHIPPVAGREGGYAMEPSALHIWPRGGSMMIALPNRDGSFTCTLFWPYEGEHSFGERGAKGDVRSFFEREYPDAVPLMPTLEADYAANPVGSLVTVRSWPWQYKGKVCILGDAAHAIVPFYGQGMNCAFEDCLALARCLDDAMGHQERALADFEAQRKPNADAIARMALDNFVEMRDKVGNPAFLYKKRVEQAIHQLHPGTMVPQYNLVSFSTVPYADALARGQELDAIYERVIARVPREREEGRSREDWLAEIARAAECVLREGACGARADEGPAVIDISPVLSARTGVWPGDTPLSREVLCDMGAGANITLSTLRSTVHLGAHADGPNHYGHPAPGISERSLRHYIGPCTVVHARVGRGERVTPEGLGVRPEQIRTARVLIRTDTFPDATAWNNDFAGLSVALIEMLASRGVITVGVDTPSVDLMDSKDLPAHKAILAADMAILEGLVLGGVAPGEYELIAPPLRLEGFDASPVRAVLRPLS